MPDKPMDQIIENILNSPNSTRKEYRLAGMVKRMAETLKDIHRERSKTPAWYQGRARSALMDTGYWRSCINCNRTLKGTN